MNNQYNSEKIEKSLNSFETPKKKNNTNLLHDGSIYAGEFNKNGEPNGKGKIWYLKGDEYEGEVENGIPYGKGF